MIAIGFGKCLLVLLQVHVADPLEEHQREDVRLEVCLVYRTAQQVSRLRKMALQIRQRHRRRVRLERGWRRIVRLDFGHVSHHRLRNPPANSMPSAPSTVPLCSDSVRTCCDI
jgi:hypothetical protein